jgi:hypothetical protein
MFVTVLFILCCPLSEIALLCPDESSIKIKMNMRNWLNSTAWDKTQYLEENMSFCPCVHPE